MNDYHEWLQSERMKNAIQLCFCLQFWLSSVFYLIASGELLFLLIVSMNNRAVWYNCKGGKWFFQIKNTKQKQASNRIFKFLGFRHFLSKTLFDLLCQANGSLKPSKNILAPSSVQSLAFKRCTFQWITVPVFKLPCENCIHGNWAIEITIAALLRQNIATTASVLENCTLIVVYEFR